ncbi:MAG: helix-turn-helix transcriptional regulator [Steroidobacteraceae bacterium]
MMPHATSPRTSQSSGASGTRFTCMSFAGGESAAEVAAAKGAVAHGRMKRVWLTARWLFILCTLAMVILGWTVPERHRMDILAISVPLFLLFCAVELNFIVHSGETLLSDRRDELLAFFRSRMLRCRNDSIVRLKLMAEELLGNRLKQGRAAKNMTQAQLAELIGVSRKSINTVENRVFVPSVLLALKLARAFGTSAESLFFLIPEQGVCSTRANPAA